MSSSLRTGPCQGFLTDVRPPRGTQRQGRALGLAASEILLSLLCPVGELFPPPPPASWGPREGQAGSAAVGGAVRESQKWPSHPWLKPAAGPSPDLSSWLR